LEDVVEDMKDKLAIVTGGASGIGLGIAQALARAGARVIITYRTGKFLDDAMARFSGPLEERVHALQLDVTDRSAFSRFADEVEQRFGNIHILCNNAGIGIGTRITDAGYEDWDWGIAVNIGGVVNGIQTILPRIRAHGEEGHVVSTASMGGIFLNAYAGIYNTTKFAVVGMMEALRAELMDKNVGVSVYCPGLVETNLHRTEEARPPEFGAPKLIWTAERLIDFEKRIMSAGMDPVEAGECVLRGIQRSDLYIFSHPEFHAGVKERFDAVLMSLEGDVENVPERRLKAQEVTLRHPLYRREIYRMEEFARENKKINS
jgi:NAD(P)-dependent dehydrogenase (short-subunit alcohol dehydrogenase family)